MSPIKKYFFLLSSLTICFCHANDKAAIQGNLPEPKYRNEDQQANKFSPRLKRHLDNKDLPAFYKEATLIFRQLQNLNTDEYTTDIYIDLMWIFYYIANAPMFKTDFDPTAYYSFRDDDDISTKTSIITCMERFGRNDILDKLHLNKKIVREQFITWCAKIFKDFRHTYDPSLTEKIEILRKKPGVAQGIAQLRILDSKISINETRNVILGHNLEHFEEDFVTPLVKYYHGKANEVRKFIKMAGYTDEEGADLIDRTVGRTPRTEFLYQGRYGKRHDKKTATPKK